MYSKIMNEDSSSKQQSHDRLGRMNKNKTLGHSLSGISYTQGQNMYTIHPIGQKMLTRVGFEPTPFRTSELMLSTLSSDRMLEIIVYGVDELTYGALDR